MAAKVAAHSAGSHPQEHVNSLAAEILEQHYGIDTSRLHTKSVNEFLGHHFDYVITVCDRAETCPVFPADPERIHWSFEDPAAVSGPADKQRRAFEHVAIGLAARLRIWLSTTPVHFVGGHDDPLFVDRVAEKVRTLAAVKPRSCACSSGRSTTCSSSALSTSGTIE